MSPKSRIRLLSNSVIEKIAAGEVIERPASVLKELVENCMDAGAEKIDVVIENAGFSLIKIVDNGIGMGAEDLQKSVVRHCTSKISEAEDLYSIGTMGFRGEALASISAVSRFSISSSDNESGLGNILRSEGGVLSKVEPVQHLKGTTIEVADLFFNVPARKKFMKSERAEKSAMNKVMEQLAISFPAVHFTYIVDGKKLFDLPRADDPLTRIAQTAGSQFASGLIKCEAQRDDMSAVLYISNPHTGKARPRYQNLYVNLRRVDNDAVSNAVREAFSRFIMSNHKAEWFCFLEVEPARIDVNIHPTKQKIKFDEERSLFSFIFHMVHNQLTKEMDVSSDIEHDEKTADSAAMSYFQQKQQNEQERYVKEPVWSTNSGPSGFISKTGRSEGAESEQVALSFLSTVPDEKSVENNSADNVESESEYWGMISCYQIHKMYIIAPIKNGMIIVDQHAAHERILYEEALTSIQKGSGESQRLLFPITFDMSVDEKDIVMSSREYFDALGFDIQDFGGRSVAVSAMPATGFLEASHVEEAVREMVKSLIEEKDKDILSAPQRRFAASFACGAAIKFGKELKQEEMNSLLNKLFAVQNPNICPHGRPTFIRLSMEELVRRFLR